MKKLLLVIVLLSSSLVLAKDDKETYVMFCGDMAALEEYAASQGGVITEEDIKELTRSRAPVLDVLKNGEKGLKKLLEEGSSQDTGPFAAIMTCGVIDQVKDTIKKNGCFNLKTNKAVKDNGGIAACAKFIERLPK